jgi:hypothetical protein
MRISTMPMFLGCGLAAFVLGGGTTFATEITIHDSPGRDYVITVDPSSDKPAADPAPQGKQNARRIKITTVDKEKGKELPKAMLGPYNVAVSEGAKGDGTNPDKGTWYWAGGGFSITVKSPEENPDNKGKKDMGQPSFVVTWDGDDKAVHEGARLGGGGAEAVITQEEQQRLERELEKAFK